MSFLKVEPPKPVNMDTLTAMLSEGGRMGILREDYPTSEKQNFGIFAAGVSAVSIHKPIVIASRRAKLLASTTFRPPA